MRCPSSHKHGLTLNCYNAHGCRCDQCRRANSEACRAHRAGVPWRVPDPYAVDLALDGLSVFLTPEQRAEAVHRLWRQRWSDYAIADHLGCDPRTVLRIRQRIGLPGWSMYELERRRA